MITNLKLRDAHSIYKFWTLCDKYRIFLEDFSRCDFKIISAVSILNSNNLLYIIVSSVSLRIGKFYNA